jgi:small subunit ribosomal protein S17
MADEDEIVESAEEAPSAEAEPEAAEEVTPEAEATEAEAPEEAEVAEGEAPEEAEVAEGDAPAAAPARPEPAEVLAPKERRRRARAAKAPATRPARDAAERQAERDDTRTKKAAARRHARGQARAEKPATTLAPVEQAEPVEHAVGRPKVRQGIVVSNKADKTITVRVDTSRRHRRYKKIVRSRTTFHAHDERNEAGEGDLVRIVESRPLSATKRWRLVEILERAE